MMEEENKNACSTKIEHIPEVAKVMQTLEKEIAFLEESIGLLTQKIKPVLENERPSDVSEDRTKKETELGENLQQQSDKITRLREVVRDLTERIAL